MVMMSLSHQAEVLFFPPVGVYAAQPVLDRFDRMYDDPSEAERWRQFSSIMGDMLQDMCAEKP